MALEQCTFVAVQYRSLIFWIVFRSMKVLSEILFFTVSMHDHLPDAFSVSYNQGCYPSLRWPGAPDISTSAQMFPQKSLIIIPCLSIAYIIWSSKNLIRNVWVQTEIWLFIADFAMTSRRLQQTSPYVLHSVHCCLGETTNIRAALLIVFSCDHKFCFSRLIKHYYLWHCPSGYLSWFCPLIISLSCIG